MEATMSEEPSNYYDALVKSTLDAVVERYKEARRDGESRSRIDVYDILHEELDGDEYVIYTAKARRVVADAPDAFDALEESDISGLKSHGWSYLAYRCAEAGILKELESALDTADEEIEAEE